MRHASRLLLTASGIHDAPPLCARLAEKWHGCQSVAIIVTASREHKAYSKHAVATGEQFSRFGFASVDFVDVELEPAETLRGYDVVYIVGGHPYHLMHHLNRSGASDLLRQAVSSNETFLIGSSAGAVVCGQDLRIVAAFDPDLADGYDEALPGIGTTPFTVLPHANRWHERFSDLETRVADFTRQTGQTVELLNDGAALFVASDGTITERHG
ncbi:MAG: Type 1 glutamine amidotransferase-like domain-containing protein [Armatimonadetes bacterium]|nr:Type 1 glutamine amidotransferase-like domain-containing protein [Armatimonadota bacterium]